MISYESLLAVVDARHPASRTSCRTFHIALGNGVGFYAKYSGSLISLVPNRFLIVESILAGFDIPLFKDKLLITVCMWHIQKTQHQIQDLSKLDSGIGLNLAFAVSHNTLFRFVFPSSLGKSLLDRRVRRRTYRSSRTSCVIFSISLRKRRRLLRETFLILCSQPIYDRICDLLRVQSMIGFMISYESLLAGLDKRHTALQGQAAGHGLHVAHSWK